MLIKLEKEGKQFQIIDEIREKNTKAIVFTDQEILLSPSASCIEGERDREGKKGNIVVVVCGETWSCHVARGNWVCPRGGLNNKQ